MPTPVMQRAEKVLLEISADLRNIQSQAYSLQDTVAKKTHDGYLSQRSNLLLKTGLQGFSLVTRVYAVMDPNSVKNILRLNKDTDNKTAIQQKDKEAIDFVTNAMNAVTTLLTDPSNVAIQSDMQKFQTNQSELTTLHNSLQSMMQTHDAALQRLQNMEGANRQAG